MSSSKLEKIASFDPNSPGVRSGTVFGLPFQEEDADLLIIPVPWDLTVSYGSGTRLAPEAIRQASLQVDLQDADNRDGWKRGIFLMSQAKFLEDRCQKLRTRVDEYLEFLSEGGSFETNPRMQSLVQEVNLACNEMRAWVKESITTAIHRGKLVGVLGGDHSTPLGCIEALAEQHSDFGILQIDAHCDLRHAYEGFEFSHASVMYNALKIPQVKRLVQVGIRDYCDEELTRIEKSNGRILTYFDADLSRARFEGHTWQTSCDQIIAALPAKVYLSFDIDGLDPALCPHTGTPVPGGLDFNQAIYLLRRLVQSGRKIIGFDLNEVSPGSDEWDANVGARVLYKLCNLILLSNP